MGERETRDTSATTRSQSVVHYIDRNHDTAARLASALLERATGAEGAPAVVCVLPSVDDTLAFAEALSVSNSSTPVTPITSPARGRRILSTAPLAIAGTAPDLAALVAEARLSFAALQSIAIIWPEEILDSDHATALEKLLGEVPRSAERLATSASKPAALAQFLERTMWRARNVDHAAPAAATSGAALRVLAAVPKEQLRALRTILDAFDPPTTVLIASTDEGEATARAAAAVLDAGGSLVTARRGAPDERCGLAVFLDDVPAAETLDAVAAVSGELIAIMRPAQLAALQQVAPNATPLPWTGAVGNARSAHDALREEIRGLAAAGAHLPWVPLIEPLLEQLDAVDVAAAALSIVDRERRRAKRAAVAPAVTTLVERETRPDFKRPRERDDRRGDRDDRRPERGFSRDRGAGRDEPRGERSFGRPREGGFKAGRKPFDEGRRGPGRDRPDRGRPDRDRPAGARDARPRDDTRDSRPRRDDIERVPRAAREGREWSERGERLRHSRRGPRRDEGRG